MTELISDHVATLIEEGIRVAQEEGALPPFEIPQIGVEVGYQLTYNLRGYLSYDLMYWGCVMRAGDQVDHNVDVGNSTPGATSVLPFPAYPNRPSCFWAQGMNLGLEYRF